MSGSTRRRDLSASRNVEKIVTHSLSHSLINHHTSTHQQTAATPCTLASETTTSHIIITRPCITQELITHAHQPHNNSAVIYIYTIYVLKLPHDYIYIYTSYLKRSTLIHSTFHPQLLRLDSARARSSTEKTGPSKCCKWGSSFKSSATSAAERRCSSCGHKGGNKLTNKAPPCMFRHRY